MLVAQAGLPGTPISPKPLRDAALGATAGLLIGLGIELLREKFDDKVNTAEEIEEITAQPAARADPEGRAGPPPRRRWSFAPVSSPRP